MYTPQAYPQAQVLVQHSMISNSSAFATGSSASASYRDKRVNDIINYFDTEVKENITDPYETPKGKIVLKISNGASDISYLGWLYLSGLTLMVPNLFGMPFASCETHLEILVEIYSNSNMLIGRYKAYGSHKGWSAAYYGYSLANGNPLENGNMARHQIKVKISKDSVKLRSKLN